MDYTLIEINKHKYNISNLSTKLLNTFDINEEISINNEIKKETEVLTSLFNIKKNNIQLHMDMQMQQQMNMQMQMQQQMNMQMQMQQQMNMQMKNQLNESQYHSIKVIFRTGSNREISCPIMVVCTPDEKIFKVIERYRLMSNDLDDTKKFIFNGFALNPSLTIAEAGMANNSNVFVVATKGIKGG